MELLSCKNSGYTAHPIKVVQFGEGNFLRAFVDYMIDLANEKCGFDGSVALVKPIGFGSLDMFHEQECQYTLRLQGKVDNKEYVETRIITSCEKAVSPFDDYEEYISLAKLDSVRFVVSNTTEAGIQFNENDKADEKLDITFPGKLTQFLKVRYDYFKGDMSKGLVMLPVELIDDNGIALKRCVKEYIKLWNLGSDFEKWIDEACIFTSTLVDRIVTGFPRNEQDKLCEEFGYRDNLIDTAEPFALWVIESEKDISKEFPVDKALEGKSGMNVIFTDNQKPYKQRKVRILNGAHTSFVLASYLNGENIVLESMKNPLIKKYMQDTLYKEVIPTLTLPEKDLMDFATAVTDRFENPFIKHQLLSISLNSVSKWRTRCMPSLLGYVERYNKLPQHLTFSLAALMAFYSSNKLEGDVLIGDRNGESYSIKDDMEVLEFFKENSVKDTKEFVHNFLSNIHFFGQDLTEVKDLEAEVVKYLDDIRKYGMHDTLVNYFG